MESPVRVCGAISGWFEALPWNKFGVGRGSVRYGLAIYIGMGPAKVFACLKSWNL